MPPSPPPFTPHFSQSPPTLSTLHVFLIIYFLPSPPCPSSPSLSPNHCAPFTIYIPSIPLYTFPLLSLPPKLHAPFTPLPPHFLSPVLSTPYTPFRTYFPPHPSLSPPLPPAALIFFFLLLLLLHFLLLLLPLIFFPLPLPLPWVKSTPLREVISPFSLDFGFFSRTSRSPLVNRKNQGRKFMRGGKGEVKRKEVHIAAFS